MKLLSNAQLVRPLSRDVLAANISTIGSLPSEVALSTVLLNLIACSEPGIGLDIAIGCLPRNASTDISQILASQLVHVANDQVSNANPFVPATQHALPPMTDFEHEIEIKQVFNAWANISKKPSRLITGEERSSISERLLDGYGPDQLISAMNIARATSADRTLLLVDILGKRSRIRASLESKCGH